MHRFISFERLVRGQRLHLSSSESAHLARVLRLGPGDLVQVTDGKGHLANARVTDASARSSTLEILDITAHPEHSSVQLVFGIGKGSSLDLVLQKATEIGVESLQPIQTRNSLKCDQFNFDRWQKVVLEACKQCQTVVFPTLHQPKLLRDWLASRSDRQILLCDESLRTDEPEWSQFKLPIDVLVGAEGGWDDSDRDLWKGLSVATLGLGKNRLRAETAALASLVIVKHRLGEFRSLSVLR